ncbi:MAG: hypothetical protein C0507_01370 [Cyanobacteria bacterium PR.3.49]|nr:hypothetical protein [Cyanobacteria bacterium PR.3.49]
MQPCCCWTAFFNSVVQMLPFLAIFGIFGEKLLKGFGGFRKTVPEVKLAEEVVVPCCGDAH